MEKLPNRLLEARQDNKLIPLIGAGVSMSLKDGTGKSLFPSWTELLGYAAEALEKEGKEDLAESIRPLVKIGKLQMAADLAREGLTGRLWTDFFRKHIEEPIDNVPEDSLALPKAIWEISSRIVTLNYDKVLRAACPNKRRVKELDNANPAGLADFTNDSSGTPIIWHLHGRTDNISTLIFTAQSYRSLYSEEDTAYRAALEVFRGLCRDNILLFVGCSLEDAELLQEMATQHKIFGENTGPHYAFVREKNKVAIEGKIKGLPLELVTFEEFGEPLLKLVQALAKPEPPKDAPPAAPEKPEAKPDDLPAPAARKSKTGGKKMALLFASPLDDEQDWKPYFDELKKISCPIDHFSLSIDALNNLQGYDYVLICSKVIKNRLLIENEYLCSDKISFKELEANIGNDTTAGIFIFVDQLPEAKSTAEFSLPVLIMPVEDKKHLHDIIFQLFRKNKIDCCGKSRVLNPAAFELCKLTGTAGIYREKTPLPESIDPALAKSYVGRHDDLERICRKLMELELGEVLTVKGAGGIGKTHTVKKIAVALAERGRFSGGIHFIDCEPVTDSRQFQFKAAAVFGLELAEDFWQHLRDHHDDKERLIIFDNFETLLYLDEQEEIKAILGRIADYAKVLVTCRELLKIEGETDCTIRPMVTDEAVAFFISRFPVQKHEMELLRQEILGPLLDNNPLAITIITKNMPRGKSLAALKEELENDLFNTIIDSDLHIFDSGSDTNIDRKKCMYASILYSYNRLSKDEKIAFELLALFPDGIHLEEFKKLTRKSEAQKKMPPLLITDRLIKSLDDKSMIENSGGHIKHQSIVGKFAEAMLEKREDIELLYRNAFAYNRWLAFMLRQIAQTSEASMALKTFSSQQENFLAAVKYCDKFKADKEELLEYLDYCSFLFSIICSLDVFIQEVSAKTELFHGKEKQCVEMILLYSKYYNGNFTSSFAELQHLLPLEQISRLDRDVPVERLLAANAASIYEMEGEALWAAEYTSEHHNFSFSYPGELLDIGEYSQRLAEVCQDDFLTFETLANLGLLRVEKIDAYLAGIYEKDHIGRMQTSYTRAKLRPLARRKIESLVIVNPYTRGLKKLMLAFVEADTKKADELYREAAEHLWHIRYYHVEALYFHAAFLRQHNAAEFDEIYQRGLELATKHHYRFLQYRFEELLHPTGLAYDQRNYPLPDKQDFTEYINFLMKTHEQLKDGKARFVVQRRRA